jgi:hypothetical protein
MIRFWNILFYNIFKFTIHTSEAVTYPIQKVTGLIYEISFIKKDWRKVSSR